MLGNGLAFAKGTVVPTFVYLNDIGADLKLPRSSRKQYTRREVKVYLFQGGRSFGRRSVPPVFTQTLCQLILTAYQQQGKPNRSLDAQ